MNMKIFVYTDADVRLVRRIRCDTAEMGRDIGMVLDQYSKFVKATFDDFILPRSMLRLSFPEVEIIMLLSI